MNDKFIFQPQDSYQNKSLRQIRIFAEFMHLKLIS